MIRDGASWPVVDPHERIAAIDPFRSLVFLHIGRSRAAVWTGDARDMRPNPDSRLAGILPPEIMQSRSSNLVLFHISRIKAVYESASLKFIDER